MTEAKIIADAMNARLDLWMSLGITATGAFALAAFVIACEARTIARDFLGQFKFALGQEGVTRNTADRADERAGYAHTRIQELEKRMRKLEREAEKDDQ